MPIGLEMFLQPALQPVFDKVFELGGYLLSKLTGGDEVANMVEQWTDQLEMLQALLLDADQKQFSNIAIRKWLRKLQDVAHDMEDVLEHLAIQADENELQKQNFGIFGHMVENVSTLFSSNDHGVQEKIADITQRLKGIEKQTTTLQLVASVGMQQQTLQTEVLRRQRESSSLVSKVFGRDNMKEEIITRLLKDDEQSIENYVMIPIVGTGGIGKTTLAQLVYNDERLKHQFNLMAWVCVSDVFDVKRIITKICKAAHCGTVVDFTTLDEAQTQLLQVLKGQKFLIVLDEIWNENYQNWDNLQVPFRNAAKGSRVIMTTRNEVIAKLMNTNSKHDNIINLKDLSDDACWNIVQQHANNKTNLVEMRADIISKCKGLPLVAKVLGGIFKTKDTRECRQILNSNLWSENENSVLPILRLSYHHLPSHLKRIFAYCSIFPKDYSLNEKELVLLWMAHGFLPENQLESMETIGQNYLRELVWRSLLEVDSNSEQDFTMHDLIHDLALWAAGDICHMMDTKDVMEVAKTRARHVFLTDNAATALGSSFPMASQLRTLVCYEVSSIKSLDFIQKFSFIRALMLSSNTIELLPECICDCKLLRLICLNAPCIKELPKSINKLWNLQTLWLPDCCQLEKVPYIGSLKKLRYLDIDCTSLWKMPWGIGKLTNLQSLGEFILVNGHGSEIRELKNLNNLQGKLRIFGLEELPNAEDAKEAQLHKKCGLDELYLQWRTCGELVDDDNIQGDVLQELNPPTSVKVCELVGYKGLNFPAWLGDPSFTNMVVIKLEKLENCKELPPLGQLPYLERLNIHYMDSVKQVGPEFYGNFRCSNPFPALKHLKFDCMPSWEKWAHPCVENSRAFASLERLEISDCPKLQCIAEGGLPKKLKKLFITKAKINGAVQESWGLHSLHSLQKLQLWNVESERIFLFRLPCMD